MNDDEAGVRDGDAGELVEGSGGVVVVDLDVLDEAGAGTARAEGREVVFEGLDGLEPAAFGVLELLIGHVALLRMQLAALPAAASSKAGSMLPT